MLSGYCVSITVSEFYLASEVCLKVKPLQSLIHRMAETVVSHQLNNGIKVVLACPICYFSSDK